MTSLQQKFDAIPKASKTDPACCPTHDYRIDDLAPMGWLAERYRAMNAFAPGFFRGRSLLDVGCNKGFFSLKHADDFRRVVGIDPDRACIELCREIDVYSSCEFRVDSFKSFETDEKFDRIFIGNGHHYPFVEDCGWQWVSKLGSMSNGQVLLEGPTGMECRDMRDCIPPAIRGAFNRDSLLSAFDYHFECWGIAPSPLADRHFLLFCKRDDLYYANAVQYAGYLRAVYTEMARHTTMSDAVLEVCARHDRGVISPQVIPHDEFKLVDRRADRPGQTLDVLESEVPACDVLISTAILHHTPPDKIPLLIEALARNTRRYMMLSGPNADVMRTLIGDHEYHIRIPEISRLAADQGFRLVREKKMGLSDPKCEVLLIFRRVNESASL